MEKRPYIFCGAVIVGIMALIGIGIYTSAAIAIRAQDIHRDNYRRCLVELHHAAELASKNTDVHMWRLPECMERV